MERALELQKKSLWCNGHKQTCGTHAAILILISELHLDKLVVRALINNLSGQLYSTKNVNVLMECVCDK